MEWRLSTVVGIEIRAKLKKQRAQAERLTDHFFLNDRFYIKKLTRYRLQHLTHSFY